LIGLAAFASSALMADCSINSTNAYSYGADVGWMNWKPGLTSGVSIGEYICSGYIYAANVGWISLGNGLPANHIQYSNTSGSDFGVNYAVDPQLPGKAILRGLAYSANVGWISFDHVGNPRLRFTDGRLEGYAWSANCGWINLGDGTLAVQTDFVAPGIDTDADGMADAFEYQYFGGLGALPAVDTDGDGISDRQEYLDGTSPLSLTSGLRITAFATNNSGLTCPLKWTSTVGRLYAVEINHTLEPLDWSDSGLGVVIPDVGSETARIVNGSAIARRFYRVHAIRPLMP
jgi:hypothetical protein